MWMEYGLSNMNSDTTEQLKNKSWCSNHIIMGDKLFACFEILTVEQYLF